MKVLDIFKYHETKVFVVTDDSNPNELYWEIEPTLLDLVPWAEGVYYVKALAINSEHIDNCYLGVMTPERIAGAVIKLDKKGETIVEDIYDQANTIIPAVASDCPGDYNLYYSKENPEVGINVLKQDLPNAINRNIVAEDLGYILRDEGRIEEAFKAFKISEEFGPSSEYTFLELSRLYGYMGQTAKKLEYEEKFKTYRI